MAKEIPSNNAVNLLCEGTMIVGDIKTKNDTLVVLSLIHISEPTRLALISYAAVCSKKKKLKT